MTTTDAGAIDTSDFKKSIRACHGDLSKLLPGLGGRYSLPVILDAMAEHIGSGLQALRHSGVCDTRQAVALIDQMERWAFNRPNASDSTP